MELSLDSVVVVAADVVSQELGGEALLLSLSKAEYFGLNDSGTFIWNLVQSPIAVRDICARLVEAFDVDQAQVDRDVLELVSRLHTEGLLSVATGTTPQNV